MTIAIGDKLPAATFKVPTADGFADVTTDDIVAGRRVVLVGVPGAFTPTCSLNHLPGFLENADAIKAKGVDDIAVVSINDHHVMKAWAAHSGAAGKLVFLADGRGEFIHALGLDADSGPLGIRSRRFSAIIEDGVVRTLDIEETRGKAEVSGAAALIARL